MFFCCCYASRALFLKILKKEEEEIEGYSKCCSITTDLLVVVAFSLKFIYSQSTNYHDLENILNDNYKDSGEEQYIEMVHYADAYMEQY